MPVNLDNKKISPQAILALKEALSVIFWKKEELRDFIKLTLSNSAIVGTLNWEGTKRESAKELVEHMTNRLDFYKEDLMNLIYAPLWRKRPACARGGRISEGFVEWTSAI